MSEILNITDYGKIIQECKDRGLENLKKILIMAFKHGDLYHYSENEETPKIKVKVMCNWCNSSELCQEWDKMSKGGGKWGKVYITDQDDSDFYVIINSPLEGEYYDPIRTIVFQMEPWCYNENQKWGVKTWREWARPDEDKFLQVRTHQKYHCNGFWQIGYNYHQLKNLNPSKKYGNKISSICSPKYFDPGHIKRINFIKFLQEKGDVDMDIYGYNNDHGLKNFKGALKMSEKQDGIEGYKYYFICENNQESNYMTEKIWEPLLCETLCFYWGCPNLGEYIDERAYVVLNLDNFEESHKTIKKAIENNLWEERLPIIRREKHKILDRYNFFPTLENIIDSFRFSTTRPENDEIIYKKYFIGRNTKKVRFLKEYDEKSLEQFDTVVIFDKKNIDLANERVVFYGGDKTMEEMKNIIRKYSSESKILY